MPFPSPSGSSGADWPSIVMAAEQQEQSPPSIVMVEQEEEESPPSIVMVEQQEDESPPSIVSQERPSIVMLKPQTQRIDVPSLSHLRQMCDRCYAGSIHEIMDDEDDDIPCGASFTYTNADKVDYLREMAEITLKFYNENSPVKSNFRLVKVCKANIITGFYHGLTIKAKEDESGEYLIFRAFLQGDTVPLYCEIKYDGIKLLPDDDDYVRWESEDSTTTPVLCEKDEAEDGSWIKAMMARAQGLLFWKTS